MGKEQDMSRRAGSGDFEAKMQRKESRLPRSLRKYIRRLKGQGQKAKAAEVWRQAKGKQETRALLTDRDKAVQELDGAVSVILETEDPRTEAEEGVRALYLLQAAGEINEQERVSDLREVLATLEPDVREHVEGRLIDIRERLMELYPQLDRQFEPPRLRYASKR